MPDFINTLEELESIKESHEAIAISLIKTKLSQTASRLLTNEATIQAIKATLKSNFKHQSPQNVTAKLYNVKLHNKSDNDYDKEFESLTLQSENPYIADGLAPALDKSYSTQSAVKA